jgi:lysophospholipase L1-like esterase
MATIRSYSATFEHTTVANAALTRWRFNEDDGATIALDSVDAHDGSYETGAAPGDAGTIGDGAARFDGQTGRVLVADTLTGTITVAAFGDSLVVNTGIADLSQRYVPELDAALEARGLSATVLNHGVSGHTSTQGLARVSDLIDDDPDVVILELGTNDALQTFDQTSSNEDTAANLTSMIEDFQAAGIEVLLTGAFGFYPDFNGGTGYTDEGDRDAFEAIFPSVASATEVELLDSGSDKFLGGSREGTVITGGVLDATADPTLNLDGLHPNALGVDDIVARTRDPVIQAAPAGLINDVLATANGSIELWFTPDSVTGTQMLFSKNVPDGPSLGDIEIQLVGNQVAVGMQNASTTFGVQGGTVTRSEATHVVFKFGAAGMELYVDGALVGSNPFTGGLIGNLEELGIGARADGTLAFDGVIDEVAVYDRALTVGEIQQLFDGGELGTSVLGTANADTILGGSDGEDLRGAFGADTILARGGDDALRGGAGPDDLRGGPGDDRLFGGSGADAMSGAAGDDRLLGHGGKDDLSGGAGEDLLDGHGGRDSLAGGADADRLFGGPAVDHLSGGAGDDLLNGGPGRDSLIGGPDADTFQIGRLDDGIDRIRDFAPGEDDVLDLSAVLDFAGSDDANDFVQLNDVGGDTHVDVDPNGAGGDFTTVFRLIGTTGLDLDTLVADGNVQLEPPTS